MIRMYGGVTEKAREGLPVLIRAKKARGYLDDLVSIMYTSYRKGIDMNAVTLSPKYQVVIPREVRERMGLRPGEKLQVISFDDRIELVPLRPMKTVKGFLRGLDATFVRERDDRV